MKPKAVAQTDYVTCDHGCFLLSFLLYVRCWKSLGASFCRLTSWKVWFPFRRRLLGLDVEGWSRSCPSGSGNSSGSGLGEAVRSVGTYSRGEARGRGAGAGSGGSCSGRRGAGESQQKSRAGYFLQLLNTTSPPPLIPATLVLWTIFKFSFFLLEMLGMFWSFWLNSDDSFA